MFKFLKSKTEKEVSTTSKEYPAIVEKIHNEFRNAGECLLNEAKGILANAELKDEEKVTRLKKIGFHQVKQVIDTEEILKKKQQAKITARVVEEYSIKYPQYKFITEEIVKQICEKYNLLMGDISQYKGFVPEKNLSEIEAFSINDEDLQEEHYWGGIDRFSSLGSLSGIGQRQFRGLGMDYYMQQMAQMLFNSQPEPKEPTKSYNRGFKICAPEKDMDTRGYTKQGHKLIPDPVVLHPVKHGYFIVTAWGDEASDELVVNEKMN